MAKQQSKTDIIDNLITTTWYDVQKDIVDGIFQVNPVYLKLVEGNSIKARVPDGTHWEVPVRYSKQDQNIKWFGRGDTFGTAEKESLTRLMFYAKNLGTNVVRYWDDERKQKGSAKIIDYANEIVESTRTALEDKISTSILAQDPDPLAMTALPTLISTTPTSGSVGGITRAGNDYLQNQVKDFTGLTTGTSLIDEMERMFNLCSQYKSTRRRTPNLLVMTRVIYQDFERIARNMQSIVAGVNRSERVSLGFAECMFKGVEMVWDPNCPAGCMYFINTESLELRYDPDNWFRMTNWKEPANSKDRMAQIVAVMNLCGVALWCNGVIYNITATTT